MSNRAKGKRRHLQLEVLEDRTVPSVAAPSSATIMSSYSPSGILVQFRSSTAAQTLHVAGTTLGQSLSLIPGLYEVNLAPGVSVPTALAEYRASQLVLTAEPDYDLTSSSVPNDPNFSSQWALQNTGQNGGTPGDDINAAQAWNVTTGSSSVVVAVMDTGVDYTDADLVDNIWINQAEIPNFWYTKSSASSTTYDKIVYKSQIKTATPGVITFADLNNPVNAGLIWDNNGNGEIDPGDLLRPMSQGGWDSGSTQDGDTAHPDDFFGWNFVANDNNPFDDNGHGTHVSGIIGATGNNGVGVAGVDWQVSLMECKFIGANGSGSVSAFIEALDYSLAHGAKISNNSWATSTGSLILTEAITNAKDEGMIVVAAAGNNGQDSDINPVYPADLDTQLNNVVSVGSTNDNNQPSGFSNYGVNTVTLSAPGENILSTLPGNTYGDMTGTSMATPFVTGVLGLVWAEHPSWTYLQVIDQVENTVTVVPALQGKSATGGIVNAAAAVGYQPAVVTPQVVSATSSGLAANTINDVRVTFSEAINPATFTSSAVTLLGPSGAAIPITAIIPVTGSGNTQFDVSFATQTTAGTYTLQLGSLIRDPNGNALTPYSTTYTIVSPQTFSNSQWALIPNQGRASSTINVNQDMTILNLQVRLSVTEPLDGTLYIYLVSPTGTTIVLSNMRGGWGKNFSNTLFSDSASVPIHSGQAPFAGTYQPDSPLASVNGQDARGTWQLFVVNEVKGGMGVVSGWSLIITGTAGTGSTAGIASVVFASNPASTSLPGSTVQAPPRGNGDPTAGVANSLFSPGTVVAPGTGGSQNAASTTATVVDQVFASLVPANASGSKPWTTGADAGDGDDSLTASSNGEEAEGD